MARRETEGCKACSSSPGADDTSSSKRGREKGGRGTGKLIRGRKPGPQWFKALPVCSSEHLLASLRPLPCAAVAQFTCLHAALSCERQEGGRYLSCSPLYAQCLAQCVAHTRPQLNVQLTTQGQKIKRFTNKSFSFSSNRSIAESL